MENKEGQKKSKTKRVITILLIIFGCCLVISIIAIIMVIIMVPMMAKELRDQPHEEQDIYAYLNEEYGLTSSDITLVDTEMIEDDVKPWSSYIEDCKIGAYDTYLYYFEITEINQVFVVEDRWQSTGEYGQTDYACTDNYDDVVVAYVIGTDSDTENWIERDWDNYEAPRLEYTFSDIDDLDAIFEDIEKKNEEFIELKLDVKWQVRQPKLIYEGIYVTPDMDIEERSIDLYGLDYDESGHITEESYMDAINEVQEFIDSLNPESGTEETSEVENQG